MYVTIEKTFRKFVSVYRPETPEMIPPIGNVWNRDGLCVIRISKVISEKSKIRADRWSEIFGAAECEIIHSVNCEILLLRRNVK